MDGDWELPAWRVVFLMLPCTIVAYFIVRPINLMWVWLSPIGVAIAFGLMVATVLVTAHKWPLTIREPHAPKQYEPDVPEEPMPPPPRHLRIEA